MIVIKSRHKQRSTGAGIFSTLLKKVSNIGVKKALPTISKEGLKAIARSTIAHKFADAVVNGTASGTERLIEER